MQPRRTIRIGLWGAEEQGLLGSREYVKQHIADGTTLKPEHAKHSAYFNIDNGTGKIRGIWFQQNFGVQPVFQQWITPAGRSRRDHARAAQRPAPTTSFDAAGDSRVQFIQERLEVHLARTTPTWTSWIVQRGDMMQMATVVTLVCPQRVDARREAAAQAMPAPRWRRGIRPAGRTRSARTKQPTAQDCDAVLEAGVSPRVTSCSRSRYMPAHLSSRAPHVTSSGQCRGIAACTGVRARRVVVWSAESDEPGDGVVGTMNRTPSARPPDGVFSSSRRARRDPPPGPRRGPHMANNNRSITTSRNAPRSGAMEFVVVRTDNCRSRSPGRRRASRRVSTGGGHRAG
ncbi:MAG: M28 family peptidase [Gemmatimonadetes bacterium]|nr:M28 family peptidase [Gemmatimonadota bacterium]